MSTASSGGESLRAKAGAQELTAGERAAVEEVCEELKEVPGGLLEVLHGVQRRLGWIPAGSVARIAHALNLSIAEVHGVVSFYHYFRTERPGRHVLHVCRAEACQAVGAVALEGHAKRRLGIDFHATSADGSVSLEPVYCLGNCALGPSIMIDGQLHGRVDAQRLDELLEPLRSAGPGR